MQVCTLLQTDNHASTPPLTAFTDQKKFTTTQNKHKKLKPGLVAFYDIRPGNGAGRSILKGKDALHAEAAQGSNSNTVQILYISYRIAKPVNAERSVDRASAMRPLDMTTMRWALRTVLSR